MPYPAPNHTSQQNITRFAVCTAPRFDRMAKGLEAANNKPRRMGPRRVSKQEGKQNAPAGMGECTEGTHRDQRIETVTSAANKERRLQRGAARWVSSSWWHAGTRRQPCAHPLNKFYRLSQVPSTQKRSQDAKPRKQGGRFAGSRSPNKQDLETLTDMPMLPTRQTLQGAAEKPAGCCKTRGWHHQ